MVVVLPAPFGPEQPVNFAGTHLEADGIGGANGAEGLGQALNLQQAHVGMVSQGHDVTSCVWQNMPTDFVSPMTSTGKRLGNGR